MSTQPHGLWIEPLDPLLFRDGRPFEGSATALSGLPTPQTLAGALRTALLASDPDFDRATFLAEAQHGNGGPEHMIHALRTARAADWIVHSHFRGPWLAIRKQDASQGRVEPLLPVPAVLARSEADGAAAWSRSAPWEKSRLPGWDAPEPLLPLWRVAHPGAKHPGGYLTASGIREFLNGECPNDQHHFRPDALYGFDTRVGIEIDPDTLTTVESRLYSVRFLALRHKVEQDGPWNGGNIGFYAEILLKTGESQDLRNRLKNAFKFPFPFGGEGRYARAEILDQPFDWPASQGTGANGRTLWYLATPAFVDSSGDPQLPQGLERHKVRAAASREPMAVSGWNVARRAPRPTRFAVPAGSVYFTEDWEPASHRSVCTDSEDIAQGWGYALRGVWTHS